MNSYVEKKENINGTKEITYKVKKIAPISLIKSKVTWINHHLILKVSKVSTFYLLSFQNQYNLR